MSRHRVINRRRRDEEAQEVAAVQAAVEAAAEAEARPTSSRAQELPGEERPRLREDDLLAIADMDPAELASLMDGSARPGRVAVGERLTGRVTRVSRDGVFVDVGGKSEAILALEEVPNARPGDEISAFVLAHTEQGIHLSTRLSGPAADLFVDAAKESGEPVEGRVTGRSGGGFDVRIGSKRAFCPISQIDRIPDPDLDTYVGRTFSFVVLETGDDVVLSRRVLLDREVAGEREDLWLRIQPDDVLEGTVSSVQPWGIFVDLGGAEGLVHKTNLAWEKVGDASELYQRGQRVEVRVLEVDREARKLSLTLKDPAESPWTRVGTEFIAGGTYEGTVTGVEPYGAFVALAPGLQGLMHVSNAGGALPRAGDTVRVRIASVDQARQRLELVAPEAGQEVAAPVAEQISGTVKQVLRNGVVVALEDGRTGWLPASEVDLPAGTVLEQRFRRDRPVSARVIGQDPRSGRLTLSTRPDASGGERAWKQGAGRQEQAGFGTLGDLLKGWKG